MKQMMRFVFASLAALAVIALGGSASALATKVCATEGTGASCGGNHGKVYTGNILHTQEGNAVVTSGFTNVECTESSLKGTVSGSTATGTITSLTFGSCTSSFGPCTMSSSASEANPWTTQYIVGTAPNGTMVVKNMTIEFTCAGVTCRYLAAEAGAKGEISITGSDGGGTTVHTVPMARESVSVFCSTVAELHVKYKVTTPASFFITP